MLVEIKNIIFCSKNCSYSLNQALLVHPNVVHPNSHALILNVDAYWDDVMLQKRILFYHFDYNYGIKVQGRRKWRHGGSTALPALTKGTMGVDVPFT